MTNMTEMKLWILTPVEGLIEEEYPTKSNPWTPWYDKAFAHVVRAESEQAAREIANENGGDETQMASYKPNGRKDAWLNPDYSDCVELTPLGERGLIMTDFHAA